MPVTVSQEQVSPGPGSLCAASRIVSQFRVVGSGSGAGLQVRHLGLSGVDQVSLQQTVPGIQARRSLSSDPGTTAISKTMLGRLLRRLKEAAVLILSVG